MTPEQSAAKRVILSDALAEARVRRERAYEAVKSARKALRDAEQHAADIEGVAARCEAALLAHQELERSGRVRRWRAMPAVPWVLLPTTREAFHVLGDDGSKVRLTGVSDGKFILTDLDGRFVCYGTRTGLCDGRGLDAVAWGAIDPRAAFVAWREYCAEKKAASADGGM